MKDLRRLGALAAQQLDARLDDVADMEVARRRLLGASLKPSEPVRGRMIGAAAVALAACLAFVVFALRREPEPLTFKVGEAGRVGEVDAWLAAPAAGSLPLRFSDGTAVVLESSARARVTRLGDQGATVRMEAGRAQVSVRKRAHAAWQVSLGPFRVDVTGTRFDIDWDPANDRLILAMQDGSVLVSGCVFGSGRAFSAGETVRASCRDRRVEISTTAGASSAPAGASAAQPVFEEAASAPALDGPAVGPTPDMDASPGLTATGSRHDGPSGGTGPGIGWRELTRRGQHQQAFEAAETAGFSAECAAGSAADLVALGDAARYVGRLERAVEAYQAVRRRFPNHERAAVAAFAIGRVAFDQRAAYADAARWFRTYLQEQPGGRLAGDALGRLMESLDRAGDSAGAGAEARRYLERYPRGPHAGMARRLAAE
jgi:transmembrane sensor